MRKAANKMERSTNSPNLFETRVMPDTKETGPAEQSAMG